MNIVIPMAGCGRRFMEAGYRKAKPFVDICGKTMIERVIDNLKVPGAKYILIARNDHLVSEKDTFIRLKRKYNCEIIGVKGITEGAACTIMLSCKFINNDASLLLANSDQIVDFDIEKYIDDSLKRNLDGSILTFYANHPKWSYAKVNQDGYLVELREKEVISTHATVGLYYYKKGKNFVNSAAEMIARNDRVKNEFYTAPAYNYSIQAGLRIGIYEIEKSCMFGLGTPEDLETYVTCLRNKTVSLNTQ